MELISINKVSLLLNLLVLGHDQLPRRDLPKMRNIKHHHKQEEIVPTRHRLRCSAHRRHARLSKSPSLLLPEMRQMTMIITRLCSNRIKQRDFPWQRSMMTLLLPISLISIWSMRIYVSREKKLSFKKMMKVLRLMLRI